MKSLIHWSGVLMLAMGAFVASPARAEITLPTAYAPVEWINSTTGDEYIDTEYVLQTGEGVEMKLELASAQPAVWTCLFGCYASGGTANSNSFNFQPHYGSALKTTPVYKALGTLLKGSDNLFPVGTPVTLRCQNETASWTSERGGGILTLENPVSTEEYLSTMLIFNQNRAATVGTVTPDTGSRTKMKLYSFAIIATDNTVRRNYVPCCRKADGEYGLYETVEGKFLTNASGKGAFGGGNDDDQSLDLRYSYVLLTSSQYLDTGYIHTPDTTVELVFSSTAPRALPSAKSYRTLFGTRDASDTDHSMGFFSWSTWYSAAADAAIYLRDSTVIGANVGQTFIYDDWVKMVCNAEGASWWRLDGSDEVRQVTSPAGTRTGGSYSLYINGFHVNTSAGTGGVDNLKLRAFTIREPAGVVRQFLPMRLKDGTAGFYDTVTGTFASQTGVYGGVLHLVSSDGATIQVYEGDFTAEDIIGYTAVEKKGKLELDASAVVEYPALGLSEGTLSFLDGEAQPIDVTGTLKLVGGARTVLDVTLDGNDFFAVGGTVDLSQASVANPFVFSLVHSGYGAFSTDNTITLISAGCTVGDESKVRIEGLPMEPVVVNGALVAVLSVTDNVPFSAIWTNAGDRTDLTDAANWTCLNFKGEEIPGAIPTAETAITVLGGTTTFNWPAGEALPCRSLTTEANSTLILTADCVWTGISLNSLFFRDLAIDLNGHKLTLLAPDGDTKYSTTVTDTSAGGQLILEVPEGATFSNTALSLGGALQLVKTGAGRMVAACYPQDYNGGTCVAAGTLQLFNDTAADSSTYSPAQAAHPRVLGATGTTVRVEEGATFDINGVYDLKLYSFVSNGGTFINSKKQSKYSWGGLGALVLEADSRFELANSTVVAAAAGVAFDLNGHTLTLDIAEGMNFYRKDVAVSNGTLVVTGGGYFDINSNALDMKTATLDTASPVVLNGEINVSNLITRYTGTLVNHAKTINVFGSFKPMVDRFPPVVLQEGATLDLSEREGTWRADSAFGNTLLYAAGTSHIVIDIGSRQPAEAEQLVAWTSIPSGVSFSLKGEHVTLSDSLSVVQSGIFFNVPPDSRVVVSATWTGAAGDNAVTNGANWNCWNARGNPVPNGVPGSVAMVTIGGSVGLTAADLGAHTWQFFTIGSCSLAGDCDWTELGAYTDYIAANATIDLRGHKLFVAAPSGTAAKVLTVTDTTTNVSAPGEFHFNVTTNATFTNTGTKFTGNLKLVKEGPGLYMSQLFTHSYTGGTLLNEGSVKLYNDGTADSSTYAFGQTKNPYPLGAHNSTVTIGAGTTFDINGIYDLVKDKFVLAGGTFINSKQQTKTTWGALGNVSLTADSFVKVGNSLVFNSAAFDLGGHTLDVEIASGKILYFGSVLGALSNGTFRTSSAGTLQVTGAVNARTVDFDVESPLNIGATLDVRDYTANCLVDSNAGAGALNVWGTFRPLAVSGTNDFFYGCTMQNGSTLDLTRRTDVWKSTSTFTGGLKEVVFAANATVNVDLTGREIVFTDGLMQVIAWENPPPETTQFKPDATQRAHNRRFIKRADGLYLMRSGLSIIFR
ncbi:MAG: hypothetical protein MJ249_03935 [Kiritimatiellae bacterium]|nr:hypothetical protein [Kiritimatiellia bacterium]